MTTDILTSVHGNRMGISKDGQLVMQNPVTGATYAVTPVPEAGNELSSSNNATLVGAVAAVTGLSCNIDKKGNIVTLDFTFTNVAVTHTDAAGSGSSGSLKIFDFVEQSIQPLASKSNLTFLGDALIDTNAGDMAFVYGFGSVAANAGDGALTGTEVDYAAVSGTITLAAKAGSSPSLIKGAGTGIDGTATAADIYFNESGSAATSDANGILTVSGTARIIVALLGDD